MDSGSAEEHTVVLSPTVGRNGLKAAKEFRIMVDRPWPDDDAVPSEEKNSATMVDRPWPDDDAVPSEEKNSATLTTVQYN